MPRLTLNMIVRNEGDRIERALASVAPYIDAFVIADTGSTDDTITKIETFFDEKDIPGKVVKTKFKNFEQARNFALDEAATVVRSGHFLLMDADMELVVPSGVDPFVGLKGVGYDMIQKAGAISYHNRRLLRVDHPGRYIGVTHEFLNAPSEGTIDGAYFVDHADGSNRKDKFVRDIALLEGAVKKNPDDGRAWFYLAQSYRDAGTHRAALAAYNKRVSLGGWEEETWNAMVNAAHCKLALKDEGGFVSGLLAAYQFRPTRAEPIYDLAKFYRERGDNSVTALFALQGKTIPRPNDSLFMNDYVYHVGFDEEFSISGFYLPKHREMAARTCDALVLNPTTPDHTRSLARYNNLFYVRPLVEHCPSFKSDKINFTPPPGYTAMNPSISISPEGDMAVLVRTVNYTLTPEGRYLINGTDGTANDSNPINTRNFLHYDACEVWTRADWNELKWQRPPAAFSLVTGLEDVRVYHDAGGLQAVANARELNPGGVCQQVSLGGIRTIGDGSYEVGTFKVMSGTTVHEKNWMPIEHDPEGRFFYRPDQIVTRDGTITTIPCDFDVRNISGSSQAIRFLNGYLAIVHESKIDPATGQRVYEHRFARWHNDFKLVSLSLPFFFHDRQIEFCAGLALQDDLLYITYGVRDAEPWLATVSASEVIQMLWSVK